MHDEQPGRIVHQALVGDLGLGVDHLGVGGLRQCLEG
jgi:hypothetical protein